MDITQRAKLMLYAIYTVVGLVFIGLPAAGFILYKKHTYPPEALALATYTYSKQQESCAPNSKTGAAGIVDNLRSAKGFRYHLRTPDNYDPRFAHPLMVVFTPSVSGVLMEKYTGLTKQATEAGMIISYVDGKRLNIAAIKEFGNIPKEIMAKWCIDENRVFVTGHSDGGTIASALAFMEDSTFRPTAIAPSAAGITGKELSQYECPQPLSVMVMHNEGDTHFPGFGKQTASWWAQCNQCEAKPKSASATGCVEYPNCTRDVETYYCEAKGGSHLTWPGLNQTMIDFFLRSPEKQDNKRRAQ